jgi:hypothetical protein
MSTAPSFSSDIPEIAITDPRDEVLDRLCRHLAWGPEGNAPETLSRIKLVLGVGTIDGENGEPIEAVVDLPADLDVNKAIENGLRPLDLLCRGRDSDEACFAVLHLLQAGAQVGAPPNASECMPLHAAAFHGNWRILCTLIDMGVVENPSVPSNGMKQGLLGSTALHALAAGFRSARGQDYAECFSALLAAGCDVNAKDRKRQAAIDIAMKSAASTGDRTLIEAMFQYGVALESQGQQSALQVAQALSLRTGNHQLMAQVSGSAFNAVMRSMDAMEHIKSNTESASPRPVCGP